MTAANSNENSQAAVLISETVLDLITVARAGLNQAEEIAKNPEAMTAALDTAGFLLIEFLKEVRGFVGVLAKTVGTDVAATQAAEAPTHGSTNADTTVMVVDEVDAPTKDDLADIVDIRAV